MQASVFGAATDTGLVRENNEDEYLFLRSKDYKYTLLIIADGMGGYSFGEEASRIAVQYSSFIIDENFTESMTDEKILDLLDTAAEAANIQVYLEAQSNPDKQGMGTTLTIALIVGNKLFISHVGDTRIYLLRQDKFYQLTRDDTYVQSLVDNNEINISQAAVHPQHNVLMKAIGSADPVSAQLLKYNLHTTDRILMCSDGLYDVLTAAEIKAALQDAVNPDTCAKNLIDQTLERGAPDNVTVIVGFI